MIGRWRVRRARNATTLVLFFVAGVVAVRKSEVSALSLLGLLALLRLLRLFVISAAVKESAVVSINNNITHHYSGEP